MRNKTHPFRWLIRCAGCMLTVMLLTAVSGCDMPDKSSPSYPADNGIDYHFLACAGNCDVESAPAAVTVDGTEVH